MIEIKELKWFQAMDAMFGYSLKAEQIEVWQAYLREYKAKDVDLRGAIEMAAKSSIKPTGAFGRVTVMDLSQWLKIYRAKQSKAERGELGASACAGFVEDWKGKVERGAKRDDCIFAAEKFCGKGNMKLQNDLCRQILG